MFSIFLVLIGIGNHKKDADTPVNPFPWVKGAIVLCIAVTGLLFALLPGPAHVSFASAILHYVCPVMVLLDYLLFDKKGQFKWFDNILWLIIPVAYVVFALIRGAVGGKIKDTGSKYPYPFLDPTPSGAGSEMLLYIGTMLMGFLLLGYMILALDKLLSRRSRFRNEP